jgi:hypothetical protein
VNADDVDADDLAGVLVEEHLGDAGALALRERLAVGLERGLALRARRGG